MLSCSIDKVSRSIKIFSATPPICTRAARDPHQRGERAIHLVSAYGSGLGALLGQVRTADKNNEITAIPELLEMRWCIASDILTRWQQPIPRPGMHSIVMVEATREIGDKITTERRYYVSSLPPDAVCIARAVRSHSVLDVAFGEDLCPGGGWATPRRTSRNSDAL